MNKLTATIISVFLITTVCAQSERNCVEFNNKKAEKKFFKMRDLDYPMDRNGTISEMKELASKYSNYPDLIAFIAEHYHHTAYRAMQPNVRVKVKANAKKWFNELSEICPSYQGHLAYYWLGRMNHEEGDFKTAATYFKQYLDNEAEPPKEYKKIAENLAAEYFVKRDLLANPVDFDPRNVKGVSTEHDEYLPMLSPDNEWVFFTRKRNTPTNIMLSPGAIGNDDKEYFTRSRAFSTDSFSRGMSLGQPFNMHMQPILDINSNNQLVGLGGACLTPDNKTMYITANILITPLKERHGYKNTELLKSEYKNGLWTALKSCGAINNEQGKPTWEGQPTISSDGKMLVFSSVRLSSTARFSGDDEMLTMDLFYCNKLPNGSWSEPINMGDLINTKGHEKTPFLHTDSKTLYFSSDGHPGIGGYDIFYTRMDVNGNWIRPINIGYPINSEKDEHGMIVSLDGKTAYFTSGDQGVASNGGLQLVSFPLYEDARPEKVVMMKGTLKDENGDPVKNGSISVTDKQTGEVHDGLVDKESGEYVVVLPVKDPKRPPVQPEKITITLNDEDVIADYGSEVQQINGKDVLVPPGGKIVLVNKKQEVLAKDEKIAEVNGTEKIIKKSDKIRQIDGVDFVVPVNHEVLDSAGEAVILPKKGIEKEKQRYVVTATGAGKVFTTAVLEIEPDSIDGAEKIYAKEAMQIEMLAKNKPIRLNEVNFYTSSTILNGKCMDVLDELVVFLNLKNNMKIAIHGHTDNRGDADENLALSKERAKSVMEFLIANGIDKSRLTYNGFGSSKPKSSNSTKNGRLVNRRVEFVIQSL